MKKKIIITGASGFLGLNLTKKLLSLDYEIHSLNRRDVDSLTNLEKNGLKNYLINVNKYEDLIKKIKDIDPDLIIHLASYVRTDHEVEDISSMIDSNIKLGIYLLEAIKYSDSKKFINTGTFWQNLIDHEPNPVNLYASTKQSFEDTLKFYVNSYSINALTLRLFDNYGPNDNRNKLFKQLINAHINNSEINTTMGEQEINLVYIDDVVNAYIVAIENIFSKTFKGHQIYKICAKENIILKDLINLFYELSGRKFIVNHGKKPYRKREIFNIPDIRIEILPNWEQKISLNEGISKLLKFYE